MLKPGQKYRGWDISNPAPDRWIAKQHGFRMEHRNPLMLQSMIDCRMDWSPDTAGLSMGLIFGALVVTLLIAAARGWW